MRAVFDANVIISAIGWGGSCAAIIEHARCGRIAAITCPEILADVLEKLVDKVGMSPSDAREAIAEILPYIEIVAVPGALRVVLNDPEDDPVLECAVVSESDFLVTGDRKHLLPLRQYGNVRIVSPAEFLQLLH